MKRIEVPITVDASGDGIGYAAPDRVHGHVHAIRYVKTDYADGVDVTITGETSGIPILTITDMNASATYLPRAASCDIVAAASLYAAAGEPVEDKIPIANERIKLVVASGGVSTSGTFHIWVG